MLSSAPVNINSANTFILKTGKIHSRQTFKMNLKNFIEEIGRRVKEHVVALPTLISRLMYTTC